MCRQTGSVVLRARSRLLTCESSALTNRSSRHAHSAGTLRHGSEHSRVCKWYTCHADPHPRGTPSCALASCDACTCSLLLIAATQAPEAPPRFASASARHSWLAPAPEAPKLTARVPRAAPLCAITIKVANQTRHLAWRPVRVAPPCSVSYVGDHRLRAQSELGTAEHAAAHEM